MAYLDSDGVFHSLSVGHRRAVMGQQLANGPASYSRYDLAQRHQMSLPSFMPKHVRVLEAGEIVTSRKIGRIRM